MERVFEGALHGYERSLAWVMGHRPLTLVFSVLILVATGFLYTIIPKGLFPSDDTGLLSATTEAAQGTSYEEMVRLQTLAMKALSRDTNVAGYMSNVGSTNQGNLNIVLKPAGKRPSADIMVRELTRRLSGIPGLQVFIQNPPSIRIGGRGSKSLYQFTLQGHDLNTLYASAEQLAAKLRQTPPLTDVTTDLQNNNPEVTVRIDRDRASVLGVTPAAIERALANAYSEQQTSTIYTSTNEYWVLMQLTPSAQSDERALTKLYVTSATGALVPLSDVADFERSTGPSSVAHSGQLASVTISFNLRRRRKPGRAR